MIIEALYPELCNLYGEAMNAEYLHRTVQDCELVKTSLKMRPAFLDKDVDFIYLGSMTETGQELAIPALREHYQRILELIDTGTVFLVTGNAMELFGTYIENEDGTQIKALGLFDLHSKRQMMRRYSSIYLGTFDTIDIVGFKSQFAHIYENSEPPVPALFETRRGAGRAPGQKEEGARINNFFATSVLGPLLILNPPFTRYILSLLGVHSYTLPYEQEILTAYNARLSEFKDPKTGVEY
ncbi:MAG: hypothetical protein FWD44_02690 [Oscillospiraceae bacterium]|nr:hypothetical protein [Oscillospiraceae bacterium]